MRTALNLLAICLVTVAAVASDSALLPEDLVRTLLTPGKRIRSQETTSEQQKLKDEVELVQQNTPTHKIDYSGTKLLRVALKNKEQKRWFKNLHARGDADVWTSNRNSVDILIKNNEIIDDLKQNNLTYDVIIDDIQRAIDEENPPVNEEEWSELQGRKGHRMTWQMYHKSSDIYGYLDYLATTYPQVVSLENIGKSIEGRPLTVLKVSSGQPNSPAIWVDSGIHAREWISPATSTYIINRMVEQGDGAHGVDWHFLVLTNPDGYEYSHKVDRLWRKNRAFPEKGSCAGVDLNRNFGYRWGGMGGGKRPCNQDFAGSGPFSEPESAAVGRYITKLGNRVKAFISIHSYGQYILYPWGYDRRVPPDYAELHRMGKAMASAIKQKGGPDYIVGPAAATLYPAAGGTDDWAKGVAKIKYAYTIELRDTGRHGFLLPPRYIPSTAEDAYAALKVLSTELQLNSSYRGI